MLGAGCRVLTSWQAACSRSQAHHGVWALIGSAAQSGRASAAPSRLFQSVASSTAPRSTSASLWSAPALGIRAWTQCQRPVTHSGRDFHSLRELRRAAVEAKLVSKPPCPKSPPLAKGRGFGATPSPPPSQSSSSPMAAFKQASTALARVPKGLAALVPRPVSQAWAQANAPGAMRQVISLHLNAFWQAHRFKVLGFAAVFAAYVLWRIMYGVASTFINLSETLAAGGFFALAASSVLLFGLYVRRKVTVHPSSVYRLAMLRLNTHPGVLEVMGAPLAGSDLRASVLTGGTLKFRGLVPRVRSRRVQMIFPLHGAEKKGLVSLEAKKRRGKYEFKLLAIDIPTAAGPDQRLFVVGGQTIYDRGGILNELRDPFVRVRV